MAELILRAMNLAEGEEIEESNVIVDNPIVVLSVDRSLDPPSFTGNYEEGIVFNFERAQAPELQEGATAVALVQQIRPPQDSAFVGLVVLRGNPIGSQGDAYGHWLTSANLHQWKKDDTVSILLGAYPQTGHHSRR